MRSELVFGAMMHVQNRYLLARLTAKTTRIIHLPHSRLEETANRVLRLFSHTNPQEMQRSPSSLTKRPTTIGLEMSGGREMQHQRLDVAQNDQARMGG
jgi:hypothetical protein